MPPLLSHVCKFKYFSSMNFEVGGPLVIPTSDKSFSSHGSTLPSSPPLFSSCSSDPSNVYHIEDVSMSLNRFSLVLKMISPYNLR